MADFTKSAKGLSRNPLGIIALFISFVYALACVVIGASASTLQFWERIPLIYFLICFPILTLACFTYLVVKHHTKLYAPKDYAKEENFMASINTSASNKLASIPDEAFDANKNNSDNIKANLMNSSFYGITLLYALHLSKKYNRTFTLKAIQSYCSYLEMQYCYGFLVAARSIGAVKYLLEEKGPDAFDYRILTTFIDEDIDRLVSERAYLFAEDFPQMAELKGQLLMCE